MTARKDHPKLRPETFRIAASGILPATVILLFAALLRLWGLDRVPPGWRDDEVVETTLHTQMILDGQRPLYFLQAEGHEPLYHYLAAVTAALMGTGLGQVRWLSAMFGLLSVAALYRLARQWFGSFPAALASLTLALSYWSLMYSRTRTRHVSVLVFALLTFYLFDRLLFSPRRAQSMAPAAKRSGGTLSSGDGISAFSAYSAVKRALSFGVALAVSLYTYYAARGLPFILAAFTAYLAFVHRETFRARWLGVAGGFALAALLAVPLFIAEARAGGGARLEVVGGPLQALLQGDLRPALANTLDTLGMFALKGDPESLYNLPGRPVFGALGAILLGLGLLACLWRWKQPRFALLVLWWLGGLAPTFLSTPAASLGHSILAQPATYLLPAVGVDALRRWRPSKVSSKGYIYLAVVFVGLTAARDLRDYFLVWPADSQVRFLYRAGLHEATVYFREDLPRGPLAVSSLNLNPHDPLAFGLDLPEAIGGARFFDPSRAFVAPLGRPAQAILTEPNLIGAPFQAFYGSAQLHRGFTFLSPLPITLSPHLPFTAAFSDGLVFTGLDLPASARLGETVAVLTYWQVGPAWHPLPFRRPYDPAQSPLGLRVFLHLSDLSGVYLSGADDLGLEPATLQAGDAFVQLHSLALPTSLAPGAYPLSVGLYDPYSGERVSLVGGGEALPIGQIIINR